MGTRDGKSWHWDGRASCWPMACFCSGRDFFPEYCLGVWNLELTPLLFFTFFCCCWLFVYIPPYTFFFFFSFFFFNSSLNSSLSLFARLAKKLRPYLLLYRCWLGMAVRWVFGCGGLLAWVGDGSWDGIALEERGGGFLRISFGEVEGVRDWSGCYRIGPRLPLRFLSVLMDGKRRVGWVGEGRVYIPSFLIEGAQKHLDGKWLGLWVPFSLFLLAACSSPLRESERAWLRGWGGAGRGE